jgi:ABC-type amino acid transport substrate-binding protein
MKKLVLFTFIFLSLNTYAEKIRVKIGGYDFPPFIEWNSGKPNGIMVSLTDLLNREQNKYIFELVETSPNRRYEDLHNKVYDIIFFESIHWGWTQEDVNVSNVFLIGGEVFITKSDSSKNQNYFNNLKNKTIRGILGYHYQFANFSTDPDVLKQFNMELTNSHEGNIVAVLEGRSNLAIVTKEYLDIYLKKHPGAIKNLLVSQKMDQVYKHTVLIRKTSPISVKEINSLLKKIQSDRSLQKILINF